MIGQNNNNNLTATLAGAMSIGLVVGLAANYMINNDIHPFENIKERIVEPFLEEYQSRNDHGLLPYSIDYVF